MALNVLIVDDSDIIRAMIGRILRLASIPLGEVHEAGDGQQALDLLDREWIDLVLADINMPVMDGVEMIETMRSKPETSDVPVIVISTEGATQRVKDMMKSGVAAWVRKPFTPEEIRDTISRLTDSWSSDLPSSELVDPVVGKVFEMFVFSFPEPVAAEEVGDPGDDIYIAHLNFSGAANGSMSVAAPSDLCVEMASVLLGCESDDEMAWFRAQDALGEVLNIIAGHISTELEPDQPTDLKPPLVSAMERSDWDKMATDPATHVYSVEDRPVLLVVGLRQLRTA